MSFEKIKRIATNNQYEFVYKKKCKSTMLALKELYNIKNKNYIIIADEQTNGVGRRGGIWHSPKGNIYCSMNFNGKIKIKDFFLFNILIVTSIKKVLEKFKLDNIFFKWPNDIFFKNMKFAGIILEPYYSSNNEKFVIIGLGINFISSPQNKIYKTTYIREFINLNDYNKFLEVFFLNFFDNIENYLLKQDSLILEFKNSLMFLKKNIKIKISDNKNISGIFSDINQDGALILDQGKKIVHLYSGSILI